MEDAGTELQRSYYQQSAARYDAMHLNEHAEALAHIVTYVRALGATSVLEVGAGTGCSLSYLRTRLPETVRLCGIEPVPELIAQGRVKGLGAGVLLKGDGRTLPFESEEFDVVMETAVLHHTPDPGKVIAEMLRVARQAVFLSDSNRFGQGRMAARVVKLVLYQSRLWPVFDFVRTRGRGYMTSEGDGVFYSYSLYDNIHQIGAWADRMNVIPLGNPVRGPLAWLGPVLTAGSVLVCAFRQPMVDSAGR